MQRSPLNLFSSQIGKVKYCSLIIIIPLIFYYVITFFSYSEIISELNTKNNKLRHIDDALDACSNKVSCYECNSPNSYCLWDNSNNICVSFEEQCYSRWYNKLILCFEKDYLSTSLSNSNCGKVTKGGEEGKYSFGLEVKNNLYGIENLFCVWEVSYNYLKEFSNYSYLNWSFFKPENTGFFFKIVKNNNSQNKSIIDFGEENDSELEYHFEEKLSKKNNYKIYYFSTISFSEPPFQIEFSFIKKISKVTLYIVTFVFSFLALIFAIILIIICKRYLGRGNRQNNIGYKEGVYHKNLISKKQLFNNKCPICMDEFKTGMQIVILNCKHGMHFNCFNLYLEKNKTNKTCPLCYFKIVNFTETNEIINRNNNNNNNNGDIINTNQINTHGTEREMQTNEGSNRM